MKTFISLLIFFLFSVPVSFADDLTKVESFVKDRIGITVSYIRDQKLDKTTRNKKIIETLEPIFDFKRMAMLSLGKGWKKLKKAKKKEFSKLFIRKAQESFLDKLDLFPDVEVEVKNARKVKKKIHVLTKFINRGDSVDVKFKFYKSRKRGWVVYDFEILGVSLIQTYRSQFHGVLKTGNIDDLMSKLKNSGVIEMSKP